MAQSKKDRDAALAGHVDDIIEHAEDTKPRTSAIAVDYDGWMAAAAAEDAEAEVVPTRGVDATVDVPSFKLDSNNVYRVDPDGPVLTLRLTPALNASQLHIVAGYRGGLAMGSLPGVFGALIHPEDVLGWVVRLADLANPIPFEWVLVAVQSMLPYYGMGEVGSPGKAPS